jgi:hypothetical protein
MKVTRTALKAAEPKSQKAQAVTVRRSVRAVVVGAAVSGAGTGAVMP